MTTTESRTTMKKAVEVRLRTQPRRGPEACVVSGLLTAIRVPPKWASDGHPPGGPFRRASAALAVRVGVRALVPLTAGPALASSAVCAVSDSDTGKQPELAAASAAQFPERVVSLLVGAALESRGRGNGKVVRWTRTWWTGPGPATS